MNAFRRLLTDYFYCAAKVELKISHAFGQRQRWRLVVKYDDGSSHFWDTDASGVEISRRVPMIGERYGDLCVVDWDLTPLSGGPSERLYLWLRGPSLRS